MLKRSNSTIGDETLKKQIKLFYSEDQIKIHYFYTFIEWKFSKMFQISSGLRSNNIQDMNNNHIDTTSLSSMSIFMDHIKSKFSNNTMVKSRHYLKLLKKLTTAKSHCRFLLFTLSKVHKNLKHLLFYSNLGKNKFTGTKNIFIQNFLLLTLVSITSIYI